MHSPRTQCVQYKDNVIITIMYLKNNRSDLEMDRS